MQGTQNNNNIPQIWEKTVAKLIAVSWLNEEFRARFVREPIKVLREVGVVVDELVSVIVRDGSNSTPMLAGANGAKVYEINLPSVPHMGEAQLDAPYRMTSGVFPSVCLDDADEAACAC
ncbi:MAG: hypothetical protein F6J93_12395 [Oscillatoria sp. SIO1A7]|nr:hypothetical protein [Oscillatoria sp. SIO1A7]